MDTPTLLRDAFGRIREAVHQAAAGQSAEALAYRPDAEANSIAWLVWHLTRIQDDHISDLAGIEQTYVEDGWAERLGLSPDITDLGYGHTSAQVGAVRPETSNTLLEYHDAVLARTNDYLARLTPDELDRIVDERWDPPVSAGVRIVSVINDCMQHAGQANYVRGMFERR